MTRRRPPAAVLLGLLQLVGGCGTAARSVQTAHDEPATAVEARSDAGAGAAELSPARRASATGLDEAELVTIAAGEVATYRIDGGKLRRLGGIALPDAQPSNAELSGDWADRSHLFVRVPPRTVLMMTAKETVAVDVPEPARFATPRPKTEDDAALMAGGPVQDGLVVMDGAVFWSECPWGHPYDGWQCAQWVSAKLWPTTELRVGERELRRRAWTWSEVAPEGFITAQANADKEIRLACTPKTGAGQAKHVFRGDASQSEMIAEWHWVSAVPPRLLVLYGAFGLDDMVPSRWTLHGGCGPKPLAQGTAVEPGPAGIFVAWEKEDPTAERIPARQVVRRGADVLGEVGASTLVRFRPR